MDAYKDANLLSENARKYQELEWKYGCHNYYPLPVVLARGEGVYMYDVDDKKYMDFLSGYSALNQGHCHPKIIKATIQQLQTLTLTARAFFNNKLGQAEEYMCKLSGYDKCIFMNTGVEGGETAIKFARRWGYAKKKIPDNKAKVLFCNGNFWGRTIAACASSDDPERYKQFGPFEGLGFELIDYNNTEALEKKLKEDPNICAFMVEPIQGEAGVVIPTEGYLKKVRDICTKYNVLLICDEIQTGMGRTGKLFCFEWDGIRPDMVILGKALAGGVMPVSAVLANDDVMLTIHPGEHGSTYGGNPLAAEVAMASVKVLLEEKMIENSLEMGEYFRRLAGEIKSPYIKTIRGRGLFSAIELSQGAWQFCLNMLKNGLLAKPTHGNTVRFSPALIITKTQVEDSVKIIAKSLEELETQIKEGKAAGGHQTCSLTMHFLSIILLCLTACIMTNTVQIKIIRKRNNMLKSKKSASALSKLLKISPREMPAEQAGHIIKKHQSSTIFEVKTIIGLVIRKPEPVAATNQNTPPLQLPKISIEPRGVKGKAHSRTDMYSKKIRRGADGSKYLKGKLKNKSFVETHSVSKKNLMASHLEAYKSGGGGKDTRHKSVERQELFDKHFTNVLQWQQTNTMNRC
eukprot:TRINITY_DN817_c0_g1_i1.p2 TRINITY_DN817_c0_g1~~TRINITY_DN817_c0_g1_i1.p2  ORF type:complete len:631 (+),score=83.72 TRINITY_DN817_c0_g1_i1:390-2282(+)